MIRSDGQEVDDAIFGRLVERMAMRPVASSWIHPNGGAAMVAVVTPTVPEDCYTLPRYESADGNVVLVTDALLSNREELVAELGWSDARLTQTADGALVMAAYERWGEDCPAKLEGHFALAVWRKRERRLFCSVDAFSFRPLYYHCVDGVFTFASTLRGIFAGSGKVRKLNERAIIRDLMGVRDRVLGAGSQLSGGGRK